MKLVILISAVADKSNLCDAFGHILPLLVAANPTGAVIYIENGLCTAVDMMVAGRKGYRVFVARHHNLRSLMLSDGPLDTLRERLEHGGDIDPMYVRDVDQLDRFILPVRPT